MEDGTSRGAGGGGGVEPGAGSRMAGRVVCVGLLARDQGAGPAGRRGPARGARARLLAVRCFGAGDAEASLPLSPGAVLVAVAEEAMAGRTSDEPFTQLTHGLTAVLVRPPVDAKTGRRGDVWAAAVSSFDPSVPAVHQALAALLGCLEELVASPLTQGAVLQRVPTVLTVLAEAFPFGRPQMLSTTTLRQLCGETLEPPVKGAVEAVAAGAKGFFKTVAKAARGEETKSSAPARDANTTLEVTGAVSWRPLGLVHKSNELYLDVIEQVDAVVGGDGRILSGSVQGTIQMKALLSGMPECKIGLNDKLMMNAEARSGPALEGGRTSPAMRAGKSQVALDYVRFHQCVRLNAYEASREINFIPPDGEFELMKYNVTRGFDLPFKVSSTYLPKGRTRAEIAVSIRAEFPSSLTAYQVICHVPLPKNTAKVKMSASGGKTKSKYVELNKNQTRWKISEFEGGKSYKFQAVVELLPTTSEKDFFDKPPIQVQFQIPMFTSTGMRIRFLKIVERSGYQATKWVRYITKNGQYHVRMG